MSAPEVIANQIEVASEPAVVLTKTSIDAAIFQGAKDSASELRMWKQFQHRAVVDISRTDIPVCLGIGRTSPVARFRYRLLFRAIDHFNQLVRDGKGVERGAVSRIVDFI